MSDINSVTLVGRLAADPEVRHTAGGMPIVGLRLAWSTRQKNGDEWGEKSNFIEVSLFGERFEKLAQHLSKGKRIGVSGRLEMDEWGNEGERKTKIKVVASDVQFLEPREAEPVGVAASNTGTPDDEIPFA